MDDQGIRIGEVSSIDPAKGRAKVVFDDREDQVSYDLPIVFRSASPSDKSYEMPDIGVQAVCVFLPNGHEEGYVAGFIYSDAFSPPFADANIIGRVFGNGDYFFYDKLTGKMSVKASGGVDINSNVKITGDVTVSGDVTAGGISLRTHRHNGVEPGGGNTGAPVGGD